LIQALCRLLKVLAMELRTAKRSDISALGELIEHSGRALSVGYYSLEQADAITRHVFGVDTQLIDDQTYFAIERESRIVACGGWSKRRTLFGGDQTKTGPDPLLDPATEAARIRAFFVHPSMARRGLGRQLMAACIAASKQAGFSSLELVATMPGEPLYLTSGFVVLERFDLDLPGGIQVPVSRMRMEI
jgi:N-acetylglutamate synthase-like GNAT family acetyltransferase